MTRAVARVKSLVIQNLPHLENSKIVLKGLHQYFKFNLCSYSILKIKNILNISIN